MTFVVLALCIIGVAAVTFLLIALVDRPKEQSEHLEGLPAAAFDRDDDYALARPQPGAHVRGAVDVNTGHVAFAITGSPTPEQNAAIATIVATARGATSERAKPRHSHATAQTYVSISPSS